MLKFMIERINRCSGNFLIKATTVTVMLLFSFILSDARAAVDSGPSALSGRVSSEAEGPMEGVLVSAKREGEGRAARLRI